MANPRQSAKSAVEKQTQSYLALRPAWGENKFQWVGFKSFREHIHLL